MAELLRERKGNVGNQATAFGELLFGLKSHLHKLSAPKYQTPIWHGWPTESRGLVADIAAAAMSIGNTLCTTTAELDAARTGPVNKLARFKAKKSDVQTLERAGTKLLVFAQPDDCDSWPGPFSPKEWEAKLKISATAFRLKIKSGEIRVHKLSPRRLRIHPDDVKRLKPQD